MGGAQVASVQDGTSGYWNPAGLVGIKNNPELNLMHAEYFAGIGKYDFASVAFPTTNNKRTFAITGLRFAVDDIMNTLFLVEPDGSINYNNIQAFSSADYAFIFSLAQKLKESDKKNIQFGVNAKVIHRSVGKVCKCIINRDIRNFKPSTGTWLVYPNFLLIKCITVCQCFLEIINTGSHIKYIIDITFESKFWICTYRICADNGITLAIKSEVEICFCKQTHFFY